MSRNTSLIQSDPSEVTFTAELVHVYTVTRQTTPAQDRELKRTRQRNIQIWKDGIEKMRLKANGIPIVRMSIGMGKCTRVGLLIRETASFIFYAEGCYDATQIKGATVKRLKKNGLRRPHLEACYGCDDHPSRENAIF